jgi:photosystem II stability/assembly factor-like uncharacterized protein
MASLPASAGADNKFKDPLNHQALKFNNVDSRPLIDVVFTGSRLVAVGIRGLIIVSENEGDTWKQSDVPVQTDLVAVYFPSENAGWAVGHDGVILHSEDCGDTWIKQLDFREAENLFTKYYGEKIEQGNDFLSKALYLTRTNFHDEPGLPFLDVWFEDEMTGYAAGTFGQFAKTINGGITWSPWMHKIDNFQPALNFNDIEGINNNIYIASERGSVFKLNKQRDSFFERLETGYDGTFFGITGNDKILIAYGLRGAIYRSTDEGDTWEALSSPTNTTISVGFSLNSGDGFLFVTQAGELLISDPSAENFSVFMADEPMFVTSATEIPSGYLILTGFQGVRKQMLPVKSKSQFFQVY